MIIAPIFLAALQAAASPSVAAAPSPPILRNRDKVLRPEDYPQRSLAKGEHGIISVLLSVAPDGRADDCEISETSGFATLDKDTCALLRSRARFAPATDRSGVPVAGSFRMAVAWGVDAQMPTTSATIPVQVAALPTDYKAPVKTELTLDASGRVQACVVTTSSGSAAADRAACAYLVRELNLGLRKSGSPDTPAVAVRYVTVPMSIKGARAVRN